MKIIPYLIKNLIQEAKAQVNIGNNVGTTMCYLGTADLRSTTINLLQWVLYLLSPLLALLLAVKNGFNLLKRKSFSLYYAVYKSFLRVIILIIIFCTIFSVIYYFTISEYDEIKLVIRDWLSFCGILSLTIFGATGLGYLFFSGKNRQFLKLAFSYILVVPSIIIFLLVLILNLIPELNKYLPPDAFIFKKEQLKDKLVKEDKIPSDTKKKP